MSRRVEFQKKRRATPYIEKRTCTARRNMKKLRKIENFLSVKLGVD